VTEITFPRQQARTRRFSLGVPRSFVVAPRGDRVLFLRSVSGTSALTCLYELDVASGTERLLVDPSRLLGDTPEDLPPEERARRERARESSAGVVRFHTDAMARRAVFDLSGRLFVADVETAEVRELPALRPVLDPRVSPDGELVAYVSGAALRVVGLDGSGDRVLAAPAPSDPAGAVTFGLAEFVAAEEMDRQEGYWWSADSTRLLVARVDTSPVNRRFIADPSSPETAPVEIAYPAAGTANAAVTLSIVSLAGTSTDVEWDRKGHEYLATASWTDQALLIVVQSRDQRTVQVLEVDPASGRTTLVLSEHDEAWVDLVAGVPAWLPGRRLVWTADRDGARRLVVAGEPVTPVDLQVRSVLAVDGEVVVFAGSTEPSEVRAWTWSAQAGAAPVLDYVGPVVETAWRAGGTTVVADRRLDRPGMRVGVRRDGGETGTIGSVAEIPMIEPAVTMRRYGARAIRTAVLFPRGHEMGSAKLPVLLNPYGGPHAQMVLAASSMFLESQWFADQGYCVVVADGRGTPGRGPEWDRTVLGDLATPALEDQVVALQAAAEEFSDLDLARVGIRGWSFGGYLAALAVLRRPDVFHAAVSGAPVTEWRLYDTHYTERYLGDPGSDAEHYDRSSLLGDAARLARPLLLIHGLADDNVAVANTLRLSTALLAAGRPHSVLPLSGVTHMTPQEVVAENLLELQVTFLRAALAAVAERVA
jgi:dipeptidyl-peptidase-4